MQPLMRETYWSWVFEDVITHVGLNIVLSPSHRGLLNFGVSFHVTPNREFFTCYEVKSLGKVGLGDSL